MNKKLILIGILLLVGLTLGGCVAVGGYGYGGYGYGYGDGYYGYPQSYGYFNYGFGYPYGDNHRDSAGHRGSWGESRHWR